MHYLLFEYHVFFAEKYIGLVNAWVGTNTYLPPKPFILYDGVPYTLQKSSLPPARYLPRSETICPMVSLPFLESDLKQFLP